MAFFKLFDNVTQYPFRRGIFLELNNANMLIVLCISVHCINGIVSFFLSKTRYGKNLIFFKSKKNRLIRSFKTGQIFTARVSNLRNLIREARDLQRCPYPRMDSRNPEFISAGGGEPWRFRARFQMQREQRLIVGTACRARTRRGPTCKNMCVKIGFF